MRVNDLDLANREKESLQGAQFLRKQTREDGDSSMGYESMKSDSLMEN